MKKVSRQSSVRSILNAAKDSLINQDHVEYLTREQILDRAKTLCVEYGLLENYIAEGDLDQYGLHSMRKAFR